MFTVEEIRTQLRAASPPPGPFTPEPCHAAVAMILADADRDGTLDVCFIRRAERRGDPWSGQVGFPGGRASAGDADALAVAKRETAEEIGVPLSGKHLVGQLPVHPVERPDRNMELTLSPFIFYVDPLARSHAHAREALEVAGVFWVPLDHLFDTAAATELDYDLGGRLRTFPGIRFGEHVIWGLTLRILHSFADIMGRPLAV